MSGVSRLLLSSARGSVSLSELRKFGNASDVWYPESSEFRVILFCIFHDEKVFSWAIPLKLVSWLGMISSSSAWRVCCVSQVFV